MEKRLTTLFNDNWLFKKVKTDIEDLEALKPEGWEAVDIPHDWLIYNTEDLYEDSIGWYKKEFDFSPQDNCVYAIRFDGVYMEPVVFVNGNKAGEWKYGYNTFELDITNLLKSGTNEITVKVSHFFPNSRWYSGAGIYRNIWFKTMPATHFVSDGIYIRTAKTENGFELKVSGEVAGSFDMIRYTVLDGDGNTVITATTDSTDDCCMAAEAVRPWDIDDPYLYTLCTELIVDGAVIDWDRQKFGFRTIEFNPDNGFSLNGRKVKLNGVCLHHDLGSLGAAINRAALRRQLKLMKDMGATAIRTSHNMPAPELVEIADEIGLLVNNEFFDMWRMKKTEYDYARFFDEWVERDVENFVRRDRNHPSVIMWSVGNEIYDTHADEKSGYATTKLLYDNVTKHDPDRNAYPTFGSNFLEGEATQNCAEILGIVGYNYSERLYEAHHKKHPNWCIYGSETASTVQSRGVYHFPYSEQILTDIDEQCSSLGNSTTSWGAKNTEFCVITERDTEYSAGQFLWTGTDYIGEPTPYQTKNSYFGQADTAGFPKDTYYILQAEWTDYKKAPMVHIFPYWDFNEGQLIDVRVTSNAPAVELFFNEKSLGRFDIDHAHGKELVGHWQLPYEKGCLKALAYDENGQVIAEDKQCSFGDAASIVLNADKNQLEADGEDLLFVEINMADVDGNIVQNANNNVKVSVTGAGRLVGLDNGDSTDYEQYKGNARHLFMGKLLAIVAANTSAGEAVIEIESPGLEKAVLTVPVVEAQVKPGISANTSNYEVEYKKDIPIRKIEIVSEAGTKLNADTKIIKLRAVLCPENCTANDLEWCVINDAGVISNLATVTAKGCEATLEVKGDGEFSVRCFTKNGRSKVNVISAIKFSAEGIGSAFIDPYKPIAAALYTDSMGELGNAGQHAVATPKAATAYVGFDNVDFGTFGSDEVEFFIFTFDRKDFSIELWSGVPEAEGSELLLDGIYNQPVTWDVYTGQKFKLDKRVKGVHSLYVRTRDFLNLRDFVFTVPDKGFEKVYAAENDKIYGDDFVISGLSVNGIGNNVSIEFEGMDFRDGVDAVEICGTSYIDVNTLNVIFTDESGAQTRQMIGFEHTDGSENKTFDIQMIKGNNRVTFVFLPGTNFDFDWFRFFKK